MLRDAAKRLRRRLVRGPMFSRISLVRVTRLVGRLLCREDDVLCLDSFGPVKVSKPANNAEAGRDEARRLILRLVVQIAHPAI
jgi:hypothetical protein